MRTRLTFLPLYLDHDQAFCVPRAAAGYLRLYHGSAAAIGGRGLKCMKPDKMLGWTQVPPARYNKNSTLLSGYLILSAALLTGRKSECVISGCFFVSSFLNSKGVPIVNNFPSTSFR
jgi:hypothetical protein